MKTYDLTKHVLVMADIPITGLAGDGVSVEYPESYTAKSDPDGNVVRSKTGNKLITVKVSLSPASPANDLLAAKWALDQASGDGVGTLLIKDLNGTTLVASMKAWISKPADLSLQSEAQPREWTIQAQADGYLPGSITAE